MKAAVCRAFGQPLVIEDLELASPEADELRVGIKCCAICASDLHAISGSWGGRLPAVYGHEASGVVLEVGAKVTTVSVGDRVVVSLLRACRDCYFCNNAESHLCENKNDFSIARSTRLSDLDRQPVEQGIYTGAFAEQVVVHMSQVEPVAPEINFEVAALMACGVATGYGAVLNSVTVSKGSTVAVIGAGGVGLNSIQGAKIAGAAQIIALDVSNRKLQDAVEFGATHSVVVDAEGDQALAMVKDLTAGRGTDFVFVTVGASAAIEQALAMARSGGTVVVVGMTRTGEGIEIETSGFASEAKRIVGSFLGSTDLRRDVPRMCERYLSGDLKLDELVSGRYGLDQINEAITALKSGEHRRNMIVFENCEWEQ